MGVEFRREVWFRDLGVISIWVIEVMGVDKII